VAITLHKHGHVDDQPERFSVAGLLPENRGGSSVNATECRCCRSGRLTNIAYCTTSRRNTADAIEMLLLLAEHARLTVHPPPPPPDAYHFAICHLDLSDIYIEMNLSEEGGEMGRKVFCGSKNWAWGMRPRTKRCKRSDRYGQQGKTVHALARFAKAGDCSREKKTCVDLAFGFVSGDAVFPRGGRYFEARQIVRRRSAFLDQKMLSESRCLHISFWRACHAHRRAFRADGDDAALARIERLTKFPGLLIKPTFCAAAAHARGDRTRLWRRYVEARRSIGKLAQPFALRRS